MTRVGLSWHLGHRIETIRKSGVAQVAVFLHLGHRVEARRKSGVAQMAVFLHLGHRVEARQGDGGSPNSRFRQSRLTPAERSESKNDPAGALLAKKPPRARWLSFYSR